MKIIACRVFLFLFTLSVISKPGFTQAITEATESRLIEEMDSLGKKNEFEAALIPATKLLQKNPANTDIRLYRSFCYFQLGQYTACIADANKILQDKPAEFAAIRFRGIANYMIKNYKQSITDLTKAISNFTTDQYLYYYRGLAYDKLPNKKAAYDDFIAAYKLAPGDTFILDEIRKSEFYTDEQKAKFVRDATLLLCHTNVQDQSSYESGSFDLYFPKGKVYIITTACDLGFCKPVTEELIQLHEKLKLLKKSYEINAATILFLSEIKDNDSSGFYSSIWKTGFYSRENGWNFPFYIDNDNGTFDYFDARGMPVTYLIGKDGKIAYKTKFGKTSPEQLDLLLKKFKELAGPPIVKAPVVAVKSQLQNEEARFPGGEVAWKKYLADNLDQDVPIRKGAPLGKYEVVVSFTIDQSGKIISSRPNTSHGFGMEQEAQRVIMASPPWQPERRNGKTVIAAWKQTLTFFLEED